MAEELVVTLNRGDSSGFGFSLLGTAGLPHVIYDIVENSPAAKSGKVEAGDVILRVNEVDVNRFSTKEVLKCLRLSSDPVTLKLRRGSRAPIRVQCVLSLDRPGVHSPAKHHDALLATRSSSTSTSVNNSTGRSRTYTILCYLLGSPLLLPFVVFYLNK